MLRTLGLRPAGALLLLLTLLPLCASSPSTAFTNNWAVLVCTSRFWFNYRHMANTLAMYRTVKRLGIPDSQIILMLADDAACNPRNPFAGTVYSNADRKTDLYGDRIEVDYKGEEVKVETFLRLLSGRLPDSTPASKRLMTDSRSNIFVYLTGHGGDEFLKFQDNEEISAFDIADAFGGMWAKKRYNEILFMVDTCQANTLYSKFYSPNILAMGSSEKDENSYSHHADNDIGVAVTDRYTHHVLTFLETINKTSRVTLQNLVDTFSFEIIHSTPGVRKDLFHRPLDEALLTDFFGGVSEVELVDDQSAAGDAASAVDARPLPPGAPSTELFEWCRRIPALRARPTLINEESAREIVRKWGVHEMQDVTVVDSYAGAGGLTRAYLELPNVKRVIVLEEAIRYMECFDSLLEKYGDRIKIVRTDPFQWEAYTAVSKQGLLDDIPTVPFEQPNPRLFFSCQLPNNNHGSQLFYQLILALNGQMWYWTKGRFEMGFLGPAALWDKVMARAGDEGYHKMAVTVRALVEMDRTELSGDLEPPELHFHRHANDKSNMTPVKVTARKKPLVENFDALDYVARSMFAARSQPWPKAVGMVAPGAQNLVKTLEKTGKMPPKTDIVTKLTMDHWILIADVFENWAFRPVTLFDELSFDGQ
ncbi:dimethyladenosine transferase [Rhodotorula toruloides]|uniref:Mitochondrial transcription factor 1 n=1 Tax=Rhodotorula toruloides TaxID=5286 RepID=A0A511KAE8_RHOTO|nr:dimethyladenosine transferase [Rhodotorula toruloides]